MSNQQHQPMLVGKDDAIPDMYNVNLENLSTDATTHDIE